MNNQNICECGEIRDFHAYGMSVCMSRNCECKNFQARANMNGKPLTPPTQNTSGNVNSDMPEVNTPVHNHRGGRPKGKDGKPLNSASNKVSPTSTSGIGGNEKNPNEPRSETFSSIIAELEKEKSASKWDYNRDYYKAQIEAYKKAQKLVEEEYISKQKLIKNLLNEDKIFDIIKENCHNKDRGTEAIFDWIKKELGLEK